MYVLSRKEIYNLGALFFQIKDNDIMFYIVIDSNIFFNLGRMLSLW